MFLHQCISIVCTTYIDEHLADNANLEVATQSGDIDGSLARTGAVDKRTIIEQVTHNDAVIVEGGPVEGSESGPRLLVVDVGSCLDQGLDAADSRLNGFILVLVVTPVTRYSLVTK